MPQQSDAPAMRDDEAPRPASDDGQRSFPQRQGAPAGPPDALAALEAALGHVFRARSLLLEALTHRSYLNESQEPGLVSNERLEFLGDAIVGLASADLLYRRHPTANEGALTQLRVAIVRGTTLARVARHIALGRYLRLGRSEELTGGRERALLLASAFEALVGALYLDAGIPATVRFLEPLLDAELAHLAPGRGVKDDKSHLQELAQARLGLTPRYTLLSTSGPAHERTFVVAVLLGAYAAGQGVGRTKREAEHAAAHAALMDQGWLNQPLDSAPPDTTPTALIPRQDSSD